MIYRYLLLVLILTFSAKFAFADKQAPVEVYINLADNWATADGKGFAAEMFKRISDLAGMPNEVSPFPVQRLTYLVKNGSGDCLFTSDENTVENYLFAGKIDFISSLPFTQDSVHAFTLKNKPKILSKSDFIGKKTILGTASSKILNVESPDESYFAGMDVDIEIIDETSKSTQALFMMENNRADIYIRYRGAIKQEEKKILHYEPSFILFETKDNLNCRNTPKMHRYISQFNIGLRKGIEENLLDDLYEKYNRTKPILEPDP